ncbi:Ppx/GppA phosphatase family protein [Romboutsia sedimentorum]|uniref:Ppx/GppA phosphatase family protein n=1 Tax=Romboutsia sedimentorum TaxID=1368474 RepID=UPI0024DE8E5E|nr:Ppx/GppA phosphatase family protein [Romboutsia sedimentorum]MDK2586921.1 Ppx/GppA phosphatase family protein [Romboutsia sedimentorum]
MRIATIDIGTNSMRLLIGDYIDGQIHNRKKLMNTTRIGQDVDKDGYISEEAIKRNIEALREFVGICREEKCEHIYSMGTSALRDSKNGYKFVELAKQEIGIDVEVISGEEESNLGFSGVLEGLKGNDDILVIDIGGGSTEFIIGNRDGIKFAKSENVGALRMTEKFLKADPINENEFDEMSIFIEGKINETLNHINKKSIKKLIGIGGAITSLSAMKQGLQVYSMEKIHNSEICKKDIDIILQNLKKMTLSDKKHLKGLQPKRADIITAGVKILNIIMEKLEIENIVVSEYDNLEGLMCLKAKKMS